MPGLQAKGLGQAMSAETLWDDTLLQYYLTVFLECSQDSVTEDDLKRWIDFVHKTLIDDGIIELAKQGKIWLRYEGDELQLNRKDG